MRWPGGEDVCSRGPGEATDGDAKNHRRSTGRVGQKYSSMGPTRPKVARGQPKLREEFLMVYYEEE